MHGTAIPAISLVPQLQALGETRFDQATFDLELENYVSQLPSHVALLARQAANQAEKHAILWAIASALLGVYLKGTIPALPDQDPAALGKKKFENELKTLLSQLPTRTRVFADQVANQATILSQCNASLWAVVTVLYAANLERAIPSLVELTA